MEKQSAPHTAPGPAFYRLRVGDLIVTAISDGYIKGGEAVLRNIDADLAAAALRRSHRYPAIVEVNAFVVETATHRLLIDTGSGRSMGRNAGALSSNLAAAGIAADDIDTVFLTHIHPDHVGGLTANGQARFPNAELAFSAAEFDYWMGAGPIAIADSQRALFVDLPREQIAPYRDRLRPLDRGEIVPGVTMIAAPGHTPGHTMCLVSSGNDSLLIWGDIVHVPDVQIAHPEAGVVFDVDAAAAAETRRRVFDMAVADDLAVMGMHTGFPARLKLTRDKSGCSSTALPWYQTG